MTMMTLTASMPQSTNIADRQLAIVREFSALNDWEARYKKLVEIGRALPELPEEKRTEEARVKGCQSQVWMHAHLNSSGQVVFEADSDALIVRGLVALLIRVYSPATPDEILATSPDFISEIGLANNLSPSRANGLFSMVKQIKYFATAFKMITRR